MPKLCSVGCCNNHHMMSDENTGGQKFRFFQFPKHDKHPERRLLWAQACGRYMSPESREPWRPPDNVVGVYICSDHFLTGAPDKIRTHPDYVPTLNLVPKSSGSTDMPANTSAEKDDQKLRRYSSAMKRRLKVTTCTSSSTPKARRCLDMLVDDVGDVSAMEPVQNEPHDEEVDDPVEEQPCPLKESSTASPNITPVFVSESDQDMAFVEVAALQRECKIMEKDLQLAMTRLNTTRFGIHVVEGNDDKCHFYTGLSWDVFITTYECLAETTPGKGVPIVSYIDQFFLTLVKLKHDPKFEYLADQAGISTSTMIDIFWKWVDIVIAKLSWIVFWPDRDVIHRTIPPHLKVLYPRLTCIIDCFEIFVEVPSNLKARAQLWSNYKKHTTMKYLIGCNALGAVTFLSKAWGGRASDNEIVKRSGFMTTPHHLPGDQILADRGFTLADEFAAIAGVNLITPAFIKGQSQFAAKEIETSRQISSVRIHIERVIGGMKNRFGILQGTLSLRLVKSLKDEAEEADLTSADKIVRVCAILYNLHPSIVYSEH